MIVNMSPTMWFVLFVQCLCILRVRASPVLKPQGEVQRGLTGTLGTKRSTTATEDGELFLNNLPNFDDSQASIELLSSEQQQSGVDADTYVSKVPPDVICFASNPYGGEFHEFKPLDYNGKLYNLNALQITDFATVMNHYHRVECFNGIGRSLCKRTIGIVKRTANPKNDCFPFLREVPRAGDANDGNNGNGNNGNGNYRIGNNANGGNIQGNRHGQPVNNRHNQGGNHGNGNNN